MPKIKIILITLVSLSMLALPLNSEQAAAATCTPGPSNPSCICESQGCDDGKATKTAPKCGNASPNASRSDQLKQNCIVVEVINPIVKVFGAIVGIVIVGTIIFGGIEYSIAGDNAESVTKAKKRITNGVIALAVFLFAFAFLQWLVPGGIFSN